MFIKILKIRAPRFGTPFLKGLGRSFGSILGALWDAFGTLCEAFGTLWESIGSFTKPSVGRWVSLGLRVLSLHFLIHLVILYSADVLQIMTCIQQAGQIFIQYVLQTWDRVFWSLVWKF